MPSKNDISGLLNKTSTAGKNSILPQKTEEPAGIQSSSKKSGRPKKKLSEKRDYKVVLSLTPEEWEIVRAKAGLAGDATFVYAFLEEKGFFKA